MYIDEPGTIIVWVIGLIVTIIWFLSFKSSNNKPSNNSNNDNINI